MQTQRGSNIDDKIDAHFSGMISYNHASTMNNYWIIDSGAYDHMTPLFSMFHKSVSKTVLQI